MNNVVLTDRAPQFAARLRELGYHVIPSERVGCLIPYEQDHADMQCLILDNTAFVLSSCQRLAAALKERYRVILCADDIERDYPRNIALNAAVLGKTIVCRTDALDHRVKAYSEAHGYRLLNVRQGYAKCSCSIVSDNALITADHSIVRTLKEEKIDVLQIGQGRVRLTGADCGFIGGASGYDRDQQTLYFSGNIRRHPDYARIKAFCDKHHTAIVSLTEDTLTDIGGMLFC